MVSPAQRQAMVDALIAQNHLRSPRIIAAMLKVERHLFVPDDVAEYAYADSPQPIGFGQTISAPHMVAIMTELLDIKPDSTILEIGGGSGYQAALLAELAPKGRVVSVERIPELAQRTERILGRMGYSNIQVVVGDGTLGFESRAPYGRIMVTAAAPRVPDAILRQLANSGRLLIPVGGRWGQTLIQVDKDDKGALRNRSHGGCVFVPLIGEDGW
jgi:protein-L-isoaspartate(D-aspartate) O-methyltransferase